KTLLLSEVLKGDDNNSLLNLRRDTTASVSLVGSANFPSAADPSKSQLIAETEKLTRARGKSAIKKQVTEILKLLE
ncbi:MAG: hypothetical protein EBZ13_07480, partial [Planctomycetia bacterium]|nr:hypothetical protein [Planctomycetia bacterium]